MTTRKANTDSCGDNKSKGVGKDNRKGPAQAKAKNAEIPSSTQNDKSLRRGY
jgi:hypothetical protein